MVFQHTGNNVAAGDRSDPAEHHDEAQRHCPATKLSFTITNADQTQTPALT